MASKDQLKKIAIYCDEYNNRSNDDELSMTSSQAEKYESCTNCTHFTSNHKCELDLVDKVLSSLAMELDTKS